MTVIGTSPPRPDGRAKVSGAAVYADDLHLPGLLYGATVRSPHPHATLSSIRLDAQRAPEGSRLLTARDLPGPNGVQLIDDSWPILADGTVRHVGEPVALVVAPSRLAAEQARAAVEAAYSPLPAVLTTEEADERGDAPLAELILGTPLGTPMDAPRAAGEREGTLEDALERAFADAPLVVEGTWSTGYQEHIYIEPHAMTAWEEDGAMHVHGTLQCPYYVHKSLVHALGLPPERVRVEASAVGGGFGGKEDFPSVIALHAALLARATGRPVRLTYDRHEDIVGTTKRHPAVVHHRAAVAEDGALLALDSRVVMDGGAYLTLSGVVLSRALLHACGPYRWPLARIHGRVLPTHTPPNGAFRGFGAPQTQFATERLLDAVARRVGLDPLTVRRQNALAPGDRLPTGQVLDDSTSALPCLERVAAETDFLARWQRAEAARQAAADSTDGGSEGHDDGEPRRGVGLSLYFHGAGFTGNGERRMQSPVTVTLADDGRVEVHTAMTDMGQGCAVVFPQMACEAGGLTDDDLRFVRPDTALVPDSGPTVASRTTMIVGGTLARAVARVVTTVTEWWSGERADGRPVSTREGRLLVDGEETGTFRDAGRAYLAEHGELSVTERHRPPSWQRFDEDSYQGAAYPTYAWGADVVAVEVDPDTLAVRPVEITAVCEVGKAIHPKLCAGQIQGGTLQAVGWALWEELKVHDGRYQNDRLATYIIPTVLDTPKITVHLLEHPWEGGPFGAKGVGELPMDGGAPAVAAAIENATGIPVPAVPATPERLFAWRAEVPEAPPEETP